MDEDAEIEEQGKNYNETVKPDDLPGLGSPHLAAAAYDGDLTTVRSLLEQGADMNELTTNIMKSATRNAASQGHVDILRFLLEHDADKEKADDEGQSLLYIASSNGHLEVTRYLVEQGADLEKAIGNGDTPLIIASCNGHLDVARYLLEQGADRDKVDHDGYTSLHWAAIFNHLEISKLLMVYGADLNAKNHEGELPIDVARNHEELRQAILDEPRRRMDHGHKRATEQDQHSYGAVSAFAQQDEEEGVEVEGELFEGDIAEKKGMVADEDQDSEPSSDEEDDE